MKLKNKIGVAIALVASQGAFAEVQPQAVDMGPVKLVPTLGVSHSFDDNIFNQATNEKSSGITRLTPKLQFVAEDDGNSYSAAYRGEIGRYTSSSEDDYADHGVGVDVALDLSTRNKLTFNAAFDQLHDNRGTGSSQGIGALSRPEPDEFDQKAVSGVWDFGADGAMFGARLTANLLDVEYTNNRTETVFRDRDEKGYALRLYGRLQPKTRFFVEMQQSDITYDVLPINGISLDSEQNVYSLGAEWDITGKTTGTVKVGRTNKDFDNVNLDDADLNSWSAEAVWSPKSYSTVLLNTSRTPMETNGTGTYIDNRTTQVSWLHDWSSILHSDISMSFGQDKFDNDPRSDDIASYSASLNYDFDRWINIGASYSYEDKDSSVDTFDYAKRVIALTLNMSL